MKDLLSEDETHCSLIRWIHQAMDEDSISTVVVVLILKEQYQQITPDLLHAGQYKPRNKFFETSNAFIVCTLK